MSARVLQLGDKGSEVRELQKRLALKGYPTSQDGSFGPATFAQVQAFQRANDLAPDGEVGFATRAALDWPFEVAEEPTDPAPDALGVDVSQYGGIPDYGALAAEGFTFVIPHLGSGTSGIDGTAAMQIARGRAAGMEVPAGYPYLLSGQDGALQAEHFLELAKKFDVPALFIDVEPLKPQNRDGSWPVASDVPKVARVTAIACLERLRLGDVPFGVYGGDYVALLELPAWCAELAFWDAAYGAHPHRPSPWSAREPALWQYEGNVELAPGVKVDRNRARGGLDALRRALKGGA